MIIEKLLPIMRSVCVLSLMDNKSNKSFEDWKQLKQGRIPLVIPQKGVRGSWPSLLVGSLFAIGRGRGSKIAYLLR